VIEMNCEDQRETLSAFLARVRPGDSCTCCGSTLKLLGRGTKISGVASGSGPRRAVEAIVCPDCGCEISEETGSDAEENLRLLSPAA
jgi:hypothetical protein